MNRPTCKLFWIVPLVLSGAVLCASAARAQNYTLTTLVNFNGANGADPYAGLTIDASGDVYGTTYFGGVNNDGTVFKLAAGSHTINTLATFTGTANGANPHVNLTLDDAGDLFGTTDAGGADGDGTVFEISSATDVLTTLATFNGTNGSDPVANLVLDNNGDLYGTTETGGARNDGTVFKLTPSSAASAPEPGAFALLLPMVIPLLTRLHQRSRFGR